MLAIYLHANRGLEASNPYLIVLYRVLAAKRPSDSTRGWKRNEPAGLPEREHLWWQVHRASVHRPAQLQFATWQECACLTASASPAGCDRFLDVSSAGSSRSSQCRAAAPGWFAV